MRAMDTLKYGLSKKLFERFQNGNVRNLSNSFEGIDFNSNDYLGLANSPMLKEKIYKSLENEFPLGSTGSRLLSGNSKLVMELEEELAIRFNSESALLFNSGMDLNIGILSTIPQEGDTIILDQYIHASLKMGSKLSGATTYYFRHNSLENLEKKLSAAKGNIFVVIESVYSMDGDIAPLKEMVELCEKYGANLLVDEAHGAGVFGPKCRGLVSQLGIEKKVFGRIITFGKAFGCHGAVLLSDPVVIKYLVNFCQSFIYTTALPPHSLISIREAIRFTWDNPQLQIQLHKNIDLFKKGMGITNHDSPIFPIIFPDCELLASTFLKLKEKGFKTFPIYSPTVQKGSERLRICVHSFNEEKDILDLANEIKGSL
jgi:8-amino-7-oxononanoate synthase